MLPDDYYNLHYSDFRHIVHGYNLRVARRMEGSRLVAWELHNIQQMFTEKPKFITPQEYLKLITDPEKIYTKEESTKETFAEFYARMKENNFYRPKSE